MQIDIALKDGRTFTSDGDKLSFTANVSTKGYKFEVAFSMGEPVETASLQDLFKDADRQIKELYKLAGRQGHSQHRGRPGAQRQDAGSDERRQGCGRPRRRR